MAGNTACTWQTFRIPALQTGVANVSTSPLSDMLAQFAPPLLPTTSVPTTRGILLKANNGIAAPIEAALIHLCDAGSACLNASSYGGVDTLRTQVSVPRWLQKLRRAVDTATIPAADCARPQSTLILDQNLRGDFRASYTASKSKIGPTASAAVIEVSAVYASVIPRAQASGGYGCIFHVLKDITAGDLAGQTTRFGRLAGPGLACLRNAVAWALAKEVPTSEESLLAMIGPSADLWPLSRKQEDIRSCCVVLRSILRKQVLAGHVRILMLHSAEVYETLVVDRRLRADDGGKAAESRATSNKFLEEKVGELTVVDLGDGLKVPAIVNLHGGVIKHDGDCWVRRDLHLLYRLVVLKARLVDHGFSSASSYGRKAMDALQLWRDLGLEAKIKEVRSRVGRRIGALARLRRVPTLRKDAAATEEEFRSREEARVAHARQYLNRNAIITEAGREAQIQRLLTESSGTLSRLVWPAGVHTVDGMLTYIRESPTGRDINKTAAASRQATTKKSQASRKSTPWGVELTGKPARDYVAPKTKLQGFSGLTRIDLWNRCAML
ncbi:unnamed protein product [Jaminaea pallidilutea]